ncbi:uncharacterized protein LOC119453069 isoform X1 [Dermacentor silvarum]|uniref:uncharacterized protein LOC119453069 isoform X1 n=1 Tax=Dermacentor silvarum TaxID=543639 RepID=UPI002101C91A|nr:uncharacterized protein LOC119453069 isoform X1 [Dermacentor silvarum]
MGRLKQSVTPEEEEAWRERRRVATRERVRRLRSDPEYRAAEAAAKRRRFAENPELRARAREQTRLSVQKRRQNDPGLRVMENFQRLVRKSMGRADGRFAREFLSNTVEWMIPKGPGDDSNRASGSEKRPKNVDSLDTKRQKKNERMRLWRAKMSPDTKAREAERKRRQRVAASPGTKAREAERKRQQRVAASPGTKAREAARKRQWRVAASPVTKAREAERSRQRRVAASPGTKAREAVRKRQQRVAASPGTKAREAVRKLQQWLSSQPGPSTDYSNTPMGQTPAAADRVKAQTVRVHRTERRWPLVMCPHHSTLAAEALGAATADFSAVFPDIDFKQAAEVACDKPPFIEASLVSTTCRVEPWRGLQDKCVGEYEAVVQHAERSCQTEHHITLVQCRKPQVSTCSVEVQADPWCQHHCGIGPIGVDLCET